MCCGIGFAILFCAANAAIANDEIDNLVRLRLSPGVVALLAGRGSDTRITARLKTALDDPNAAVRSVAARVTAVQKIVALSQDLTQALEREEDVDAAREELRALRTVAGEAADSAAAKIAKKFSPRLDGFVTQLMGQLRGVQEQVPSAAAFGKAVAGELPGLRLISGLPRGLSYDLLAIGGCRSSPASDFFGIADVEYRADGLPGAVHHISAYPRDDCRRTAGALFLMSRQTEKEQSAALKGQYLAVFNPDALVCAEEPDLRSGGDCRSEREVLRVGGPVAPPKLKTRVEAFYPIQARKLRREGASIYEAVVAADGCVRGIRLLKGSHPDLDARGMEAVAQWRYLPATLNGQPFPAYLTVTVVFSLK